MPQTATRVKTLYVDMVLQIILSISKKLGRKFYRQYQSHAITNFVNTYKMKAKRFEFEAYTNDELHKLHAHHKRESAETFFTDGPVSIHQYFQVSS